MKKIQKVCLSLFMSSVLLASGVISKAINCDVVLSGDEIMPTDLYDVDFDQALQKNLKSADVIVLGDFEFQDTRGIPFVRMSARKPFRKLSQSRVIALS